MKLSSTEIWALARLAFWQLDRGRYREAEAIARGVLAIDPHHGEAWAYFAIARRNQRDLEGAIRALAEAYRHRPEREDFALLFVECLMQAGRRQEARQVALQSLDRNLETGMRHRFQWILETL